NANVHAHKTPSAPSLPSKIVVDANDARDTVAVDHTFDQAPNAFASSSPSRTPETPPTTPAAARSEAPRTLPIAAIVGALVVGLGVGFGIAKATSTPARSSADCPMSSPAEAAA